jgi:hypothetical protein
MDMMEGIHPSEEEETGQCNESTEPQGGQNREVVGGLVDPNAVQRSQDPSGDQSIGETDDPRILAYEVLEGGELGVVAGLIDPDATSSQIGEGKAVPEEISTSNIADLAIEGSKMSLLGKTAEELQELFDMVDEVSRRFFVLDDNARAKELSEKLRNLVENYRTNPENFLERYSEIDFGNLPEVE